MCYEPQGHRGKWGLREEMGVSAAIRRRLGMKGSGCGEAGERVLDRKNSLYGALGVSGGLAFPRN